MTSGHRRALTTVYRGLDPRQRVVALIESYRRGLRPDDELFRDLKPSEAHDFNWYLEMSGKVDEYVARHSRFMFLTAKRLSVELRRVHALRMAVRLGYDLQSQQRVTTPSSGKGSGGRRSKQRLVAISAMAVEIVVAVDEDLRTSWHCVTALEWLADEVERRVGCSPLMPRTREDLDAARRELEANATLLDELTLDARPPLPEPDGEELHALWKEVVGAKPEPNSQLQVRIVEYDEEEYHPYRGLDRKQRAVAAIESLPNGNGIDEAVYDFLDEGVERDLRSWLEMAWQTNWALRWQTKRIRLIAGWLAANLRFIEAVQGVLDVAAEWKEERARLQPSAAACSGDAASRQQSEDTLATLQDTAAATRAMVQEELPFLMRRQVAPDWLVGEIERELGCDALAEQAPGA